MPEEIIRTYGGISCLVFQNLLESGIKHGLTLRRGGVSREPYHSLNLGLHVGDDTNAVLENRLRLAAALGYEADLVTVGRQVHGTQVAVVTPDLAGRGHKLAEEAINDADGLITAVPGVTLMAHSADCTLLFFHDPKARVVGLAHAGWRGAAANMAAQMVEAMAGAGCLRENLQVALGPSLQPCCCRVGENVVEAIPPKMRRYTVLERDGGLYFDLPGMQRLQLLEAGICAGNLAQSKFCTRCRDDIFFSHRASGGKTGRMAGVISLI